MPANMLADSAGSDLLGELNNAVIRKALSAFQIITPLKGGRELHSRSIILCNFFPKHKDPLVSRELFC